MVRHVVCFKLRDNSEEAKKKAKEILSSMEGNVPQLRNIWVGTDFLGSDRSYDVILMDQADATGAAELQQSLGQYRALAG